MAFSWTALLVICPLVALAGFIDSMVGGGGLISLPAWLALGLPAQVAAGCNKFGACWGTLVATLRFLRKGKVVLPAALLSMATALLGSWGGARLALWVPEAVLRWTLVLALPVLAVVLLWKRRLGEVQDPEVMGTKRARTLWLSALAGLVIGAYDGFFGPGTGTFLILIYTALIGFDWVTASANAKCVNLASNLAAMLTFLVNGRVILWLAVPAACFGILGNWFGSGLAIKGGAKVIRPMMFVALGILFVKVLWDLLA